MGKDVGVGGITGSHRCGVQEEGRDVGVYGIHGKVFFLLNNFSSNF